MNLCGKLKNFSVPAGYLLINLRKAFHLTTSLHLPVNPMSLSNYNIHQSKLIHIVLDSTMTLFLT